ncbi:uncharacterized protein LOC101863362 [Aplysia californica]|uniref:Uncharacterized protein LOC101863362 n=1 Tax=Aplysia californica TaxID=6500 RepID=A0ABM1A591_APLCA|nr:uncharacterized protein LOC101863362 [Aplysia californica]
MEATSLITGNDATSSAKRRRQDAYRKDLELQMREKDAAKLRERYQGMAVNASGWLDPEKRPERLKPLGGSGFYTDRTDRDSKVRPYHTLFLYGRVPEQEGFHSARAQTYAGGRPGSIYVGESPRVAAGGAPPLQLSRLHLDNTAGLQHYPLTEATAGAPAGAPYHSINQAYNFYATRDLDRPGYGSIVQPLVVPYVDNRPIIMPGRYEGGHDYHPKFNPFQNNDASFHKELKTMLGISQLEVERRKAQMAKDQDDQHRRLRREIDDERRRLADQESEARRRLEAMRRDLDDKRKEHDRQRLYAEKAKSVAIEAPKTAPLVVRPSSNTLLHDMEDTRKRLIDERLKIEELLRAQQKDPGYTQVKVLKRPPPPPTPPDPDHANPNVVQEFNLLKNKEARTRQMFRSVYPDVPETNNRLDYQQKALLRQQEQSLINRAHAPHAKTVTYKSSMHYGRPDWMDKTPTPFPHRLRRRDRLYTTSSLDGDLDGIYRRTERSLDAWGGACDPDKIIDQYESLRLRGHRPSSADTLTDDTWLRPASVTVV